MRALKLVTALSLMTIATACRRGDATASHVTLTSADALRAAFNADSGKVRAIFLASPT